MMLHGADRSVDTLGQDLRALAIKASAVAMRSDESDPGGTRDYDLEQTLTSALAYHDNDAVEAELLDSLFSRMERRYGLFPHYEKAIQVLAKARPDAFLDRLMSYAGRKDDEELHWVDNSFGENAPLDGIDPTELADWCSKGNDIRRWRLIGHAISVFEKEKEGGVRLSEQAQALVRLCPEPEAIIGRFGLHLSPSSWSGNRSVHIEQRAAALSELLNSEDARIVAATEKLLTFAKEVSEKEKKREKAEDAAREQTFE